MAPCGKLKIATDAPCCGQLSNDLLVAPGPLCSNRATSISQQRFSHACGSTLQSVQSPSRNAPTLPACHARYRCGAALTLMRVTFHCESEPELTNWSCAMILTPDGTSWGIAFSEQDRVAVGTSTNLIICWAGWACSRFMLSGLLMHVLTPHVQECSAVFCPAYRSSNSGNASANAVGWW